MQGAEGIARYWWVLLLYGLLAIAFAACGFFRPLQTSGALVMVLGALALAEGAASLAAALAGAVFSRGWTVSYALVSIVFGLMAIWQPAAVAGALILLVAVWLLVSGIYRILFAIRVRRFVRNEWMIFASGLLAVVLGLLFVFRPAAGLLAMTFWISLGALFYGLLQVVVAFLLRRFRV